jgi:hypothetical protein
MKKAPIKRVFVAIGLMLGLLLIPTNSIYAQSGDTSNGLEISPALVEVNGDVAKSYTINVKVHNVTKSTLNFVGSVDDFGAKDETGQPSIILDTNNDLPTSIKSWVEVVPSFSLNAGDSKSLKVTIDIPRGAEPGGHYGVIRFTGKAPDDAATVGQVASAGTLILLRVSGNVKEKLDLVSFAASKDGKNGSLFETGPLTFVTRFTNSGSVHVKPIGQIEIRDSFGHSVATLPVNDAKGNILPGSTRRFESALNKSWLFGHYTADISIAYGTTGGAIVESISFWVIPYKLVLLALFGLVTIIYVLRVAIKRYNTYIIAQSRKQRKPKK